MKTKPPAIPCILAKVYWYLVGESNKMRLVRSAVHPWCHQIKLYKELDENCSEMLNRCHCEAEMTEFVTFLFEQKRPEGNLDFLGILSELWTERVTVWGFYRQNQVPFGFLPSIPLETVGLFWSCLGFVPMTLPSTSSTSFLDVFEGQVHQCNFRCRPVNNHFTFVVNTVHQFVFFGQNLDWYR